MAETTLPEPIAEPLDVVTPASTPLSVVTDPGDIVVVSSVPHAGLSGAPYVLASETARYTTTQTSTVLVAAGATEQLTVTSVQIQVGGTTAGELQLYFGTGAYARGTNYAIFDGEFAPSATNKPGVIMTGPFISGALDSDLRVTTSAALNPLTITVWYYLFAP